MKCYDCGGLIAPGADKCPACNCPAERMQAVKCLETRLLTARVEAESALDQLGRAKVAMLCAAFFCACRRRGRAGACRGRRDDAGRRDFHGCAGMRLRGTGLSCPESSADAFDRGISAQLALSRRVSRSGDRRGHGAESLVRRAVCPHYEPCRIVGTKNR